MADSPTPVEIESPLTVTIQDIPEDVLRLIFARGFLWVDLMECVQFVCKRWRHLVWISQMSIPAGACRAPPPELLPNLTSLDLPRPQHFLVEASLGVEESYGLKMSRALIGRVAEFSNLQHLVVSKVSAFSAASMQQFIQVLPEVKNLTTLALQDWSNNTNFDAPISDDELVASAFAAVGKLSKLRNMNLECPNLSWDNTKWSSALAHLANLPKLKVLRIRCLTDTIDDWSVLKVVKSLKRLVLPNPQLSLWREAVSGREPVISTCHAIVDQLIKKDLLFVSLGHCMDARNSTILLTAFRLGDASLCRKILDSIHASGFQLGQIQPLVAACLRQSKRDELFAMVSKHPLTAARIQEQFKRGFKPQYSPLVEAAKSSDAAFLESVLQHYGPHLAKGIRFAPARMTEEAFAAVRASARGSLRGVLTLLERYPWVGIAPGGLQACLLSQDTRVMESLLQTLSKQPNFHRVLNSTGFGRKSALSLAVEAMKLPFVELLVKAGADPYQIGLSGVSPLDLAISMDDGLAALIVRHMNQLPTSAMLQNAIEHRRNETIREMLNKLKAEGEKTTKNILEGISIAPLAGQAGCVELLSLLIEAGAHHFIPYKGMPTAVAAVSSGDIETLKYVASLPGINLNARWETYAGSTALMEAVHLKRFDMVQLLLEKGAEVDRTDNKGRTPLAVAFSGAVNDSIVEALVKFGAEINSADRDGRTPISYAISMGAVGAADALYRAGAKIDFSLSDGSTVLHMAPNIQTIRWLMTVGNGVNPNAVDKLGRTTLNLELQKKPPGIDKCLALMECFPDTLDIFLPDASGKSPVAVAKKKGKLDILSHFASQKPETAVRFLLEASKAGATGLSVPSSILELPHDRRREVLRIRDDSGCTALHWACKSRNSALVKALLEAGADVNTRDSSNRTPLHFVCGAEAQQVTSRFLLSSLADRLINLKALMGTDSGSNTPAVSQKAEVDVVDSQGYTALSYAIRAGFDDLAVELLNYGAAVLPSTFDSSSPKSAEMLRNPLGIAVAVNSPLIPTLLKHGDLINRADPTTGNTPLLELLLKSIMPASPADIELVRSLVEAGADVHAERKDGVRASELLRKRIPPSSPIIYMLMEKGVDVNGPATASDTLVSNAFAAEPAAPAFSPSLFSTSNQKSPFGGGKFVNPFAGFTESLQNAGLLGAPPADLFAVPNPFDAIASPAVPQPQQQPAAQQQQANPFGQQPQPQAVIPPLFGVLQFGHTQDANQQQQQPQMQQNPVNPFASLYPPQNLFG